MKLIYTLSCPVFMFACISCRINNSVRGGNDNFVVVVYVLVLILTYKQYKDAWSPSPVDLKEIIV